jgi:diguanylate cyclase (GGDEF)-like protein
MVTVISRFRVRNGFEEEVARAFLDRPRLVEKTAGFCGLRVLRDAADASIFLLLTHWADEGAFRTWHSSEAHHQSHAFLPAGLKLDSSFTSLTVGNSIEDPSGIRRLSDAIESRPHALSRWLMESDAVLALLLAPDGTIRERNRASHQFFNPDQSSNPSGNIWDYLGSLNSRLLRERLLDPTPAQNGSMLLNLKDGQENPITLEVTPVQCDKSTLLLGVYEHRHDLNFQAETFKLTNDLAMMMRESAQKNRQLKEANEAIERLARTDALTGLANRRTLDEAFRREIPRAERRSEPLSIIMADLDDFKSINDQYGHATGDQVLASAAAVFGKQLRPYDLASRYGGEEFALLLPGTSAEDAVTIAERIRKQIGKLQLAACPRQITISLGVATWRQGESADRLVARADGALYEAKNAGRNRVEAASTIPSARRLASDS